MPWPDFVVIGAAKAGTTALDAVLRQHPDLFLPEHREPNHFAFPDRPVPYRDLAGAPAPMARTSVTTTADYLALFEGAAGAPAGEVSPAYLYVPETAAHLADRAPDVRLVAVLRDPADRAFSAYQHLRREGREPLGFGAALDAEEARIRADVGLLWRYVDVGRYATQLHRFLERFPRERLHLIRFEDLRTRVDEVVRDLFTFLEVDPAVRVDASTRWNPSGVPRSGVVQRVVNPPPAVRRRLLAAVPRRWREAVRRRHARALARNLRRAVLEPRDRARVVAALASEITEIERLTGWDLETWRR